MPPSGSFEAMECFAFAQAADGGEGGELFAAGLGLAVLPVIDGEPGDADEFAVVGGGDAELGAMGAKPIRAEAEAVDGVGSGDKRSRAAGGFFDGGKARGESLDGALEGGDVAAMLGGGTLGPGGLGADLAACKAANVIVERNQDIRHVEISNRASSSLHGEGKSRHCKQYVWNGVHLLMLSTEIRHFYGVNKTEGVCAGSRDNKKKVPYVMKELWL